MRCQKCGLTNSPNARFCKQCGTALPRGGAANPDPEPLQATAATNYDGAAVLPQTPAREQAAFATPSCPQCATPRVDGKRFCRQCRFDFSSVNAADAPLAEPLPYAEILADQQATALAEAAAREAAAGEVEQNSAALRAAQVLAAQQEAARAAQQHAVQLQAVDQPALVTAASSAATAVEAQTCPQCATLRGAGKRFCRSCRYDFAAQAASQHVKPPLTTEPKPGAATAAPQPQPQPAESTAKPFGTNKPLIIGIAAVVVIGIAAGAGFLIRSQHAKNAQDQASQIDEKASASLAAASSARLPDMGPPAASDAAVAVAGKTGNAVMPDAASLPVTSTTVVPIAAAVQDPAPPGDKAAPVAQTPAAPPAQNPTLAPARPKPRKSTRTANADGQNPTVRAAIEGSLADGNLCFSSKKFDCAITNSDAVLRLDPHNSQAMALRRRAKGAQDNALNSLSIQ
jgi:hypothetical protein